LPFAADRGHPGYRVTVGVGIIGYGYWGPNLLRNFAERDDVTVRACADLSPERRAVAAQRHPGVTITADADAVLTDPAIDAVVIATPVSTHYALARTALERGKHVLVEKPMADRAADAEALLALAERQGRVLMVDHTFVYTGAVRRMRAIIDSGELGELHYLDAVRVNLGLFQTDVDVLWDLAPHDLSILAHLVPEAPRAISAAGAHHTGSGLVDVAYMTLHYASNFIAHLHVNWLSPVKVRRMLIGGSRRMLVYDDVEPSEKLRVYDRGIEVATRESMHRTLVDYRLGDMWAPKIDLREALAVECEHFIACVRGAAGPATGGEGGLRIVRWLEAASRSLAEGGCQVPV
jgi:predicted dehydrogenase